MSSTEDPSKKLALSPDPRIKITTSGGSPAITMTRGASSWAITDASGGEIPWQPGDDIDMTPDPGATTVSVKLTDNSGLGFNKACQIQTLDDQHSATFSVAATTDDMGQEYEFRLAKVTEVTQPVGQYYYIRGLWTDLNEKPIFAASGSGLSYIHTFHYSESSDPYYRWLFVPNSSEGTMYLMPYNLGAEAFFQKSSSNTYSKSSSFHRYTWDPTTGTISADNQAWTAPGSTEWAPSSQVKADTISTGNSTQQWQLIPAEFGPLWTDEGVLGPTSQT